MDLNAALFEKAFSFPDVFVVFDAKYLDFHTGKIAIPTAANLRPDHYEPLPQHHSKRLWRTRTARCEPQEECDQSACHAAPPGMSFLSRATATSAARRTDSCSARERPPSVSR